MDTLELKTLNSELVRYEALTIARLNGKLFQYHFSVNKLNGKGIKAFNDLLINLIDDSSVTISKPKHFKGKYYITITIRNKFDVLNSKIEFYFNDRGYFVTNHKFNLLNLIVLDSEKYNSILKFAVKTAEERGYDMYFKYDTITSNFSFTNKPIDEYSTTETEILMYRINEIGIIVEKFVQ